MSELDIKPNLVKLEELHWHRRMVLFNLTLGVTREVAAKYKARSKLKEALGAKGISIYFGSEYLTIGQNINGDRVTIDFYQADDSNVQTILAELEGRTSQFQFEERLAPDEPSMYRACKEIEEYLNEEMTLKEFKAKKAAIVSRLTAIISELKR